MAIFRLELEKTIVMLDFSTFNLSKCYISCKKNFFKCRTKYVLFGYFWAGTRKSYCTEVFFTSAPSNFVQKQNSLNLGVKLFQLGILGWNFKKLMLNLKSAFSNLLTCKVSSKNKQFLNLEPKIPYLDIFGMQFIKAVIKLLISTLEFMKI